MTFCLGYSAGRRAPFEACWRADDFKLSPNSNKSLQIFFISGRIEKYISGANHADGHQSEVVKTVGSGGRQPEL